MENNRSTIIRKIQNFFLRRSTWRNIILFLALSLSINVLFAKSAEILKYGIPDILFHYSSDQFYELFQRYNPQEIQYYVRTILLLDFIYPIFYTLFTSLLIFKLSQKTYLSLFPFGIMILDYFENITVLTLVQILPSQNLGLATIAGYFTSIKWLSAIICLVIVLILTLGKLKTWLFLKKS
jgi:hypothetical protein